MSTDNLKTIKRYFDSGRLMFEYFENEKGEKIRYFRHWFENGQIMAETWYENGLAEGISRQWSENGKLLMYAELHKGKLHGHFQCWWDDGVIKEEGVYVEDKRQIGYRWYSLSGELWQALEDKDIQK